MVKFIRRQVKSWGLRGFITSMVTAALVATSISLFHQDAYEVINPPPSPYGDIKNDLSVGTDEFGRGLVDGPTVGAAADFTYDDARLWLSTAGISYEFSPSVHWSSRGTYEPEAIVVHVTAGGTCDGIRNYFRENSLRVSAHFTVCKEGHVWQQVNTGDAAHHAGIWGARYNTDNPLIHSWRTRGLNPNTMTIGIETVLAPGQWIDNYPEQRRALVELLTFLAVEHKIEPDRIHIIEHAEIDAVNRPIDPNCCMDLNKLVSEVADRVYGAAKPVGEWGDCLPDQPYICWNNWTGLLVNRANGYYFDGVWRNPAGIPEWEGPVDWGGYYNNWTGVWWNADFTWSYTDATGWVCQANCAPPPTPTPVPTNTPGPIVLEPSEPIPDGKGGILGDDELVIIVPSGIVATLAGVYVLVLQRADREKGKE